MRRLNAAAAALVALAIPASAQGVEVPREGAKPEKPGPRETVLRAIERVEAREEVVARARVTHEEADNPMAGMVNVAVLGAGGAPSKPFAGEIEAWRTKDGTLVLLSGKRLPGFSMFVSGETVVAETLVADERIRLAPIKSELVPLLELDRLALWMKKAKWNEAARDETAGEVTYAAELSKRLVRTGEAAGGGPALMGRPRALRVEARLTLSPQGDLREARFRVVRTDPMQKMMKFVARQGGPGAPPAPPAQGADGDEEEGGSSTYTFTFDAGRPSQRAQAFKAKIKRILAGEE